MRIGLFQYGVHAMEKRYWAKLVIYLYKSREKDLRLKIIGHHLRENHMVTFLNTKRAVKVQDWL